MAKDFFTQNFMELLSGYVNTLNITHATFTTPNTPNNKYPFHDNETIHMTVNADGRTDKQNS